MKKLRTLSVLYTGIAIMMLSGNGSAAIIYTETPIADSGTVSDVDYYTDGHFVANAFIPIVSDTISTVAWQGSYFNDRSPQASDDFTINFYSDNGGSVGGLLGSFNVGDSVNRTISPTDKSFDIFSYQADIGSGMDVLLGSTYWISIFNDTTVDTNDSWIWSMDSHTRSTNLLPHLSLDGTSWTAWYSYSFFFVLASEPITPFPFPIPDPVPNPAVPVPAAVWLFGSGLLGLIGLARRKA